MGISSRSNTLFPFDCNCLWQIRIFFFSLSPVHVNSLTEDLGAGDGAHLGNTVGVPQHNTDLRGSGTLPRKLGDGVLMNGEKEINKKYEKKIENEHISFVLL